MLRDLHLRYIALYRRKDGVGRGADALERMQDDAPATAAPHYIGWRVRRQIEGLEDNAGGDLRLGFADCLGWLADRTVTIWMQ